jgi:hypothetical protein
VNDPLFAVLPPYFDADHATIEKIHLLLKEYHAVRSDRVTADMH